MKEPSDDIDNVDEALEQLAEILYNLYQANPESADHINDQDRDNQNSQ
jgi:hypothetical protein